MKKLIINADDFGLSDGCNQGILQGHQEGLISSTTVMMTCPNIEKTIALLRNVDDLGVGVHLCITSGRPLTDGQSFRDKDGSFKKRNTYLHGIDCDIEEVYQEWKAQIDTFIKLAGRMPDHFDSHHHIHLMPRFLSVTRKLSQEYNLPLRQEKQVITNQPFVPCFTDFHASNANIETLEKIITMPEETVEIMTHPAFCDQHLCEISSYNTERKAELDFWMNPNTINFLNNHHITITNYTKIAKS
ncbi:carbohydrate deacetylase [Sharpea porci]|uniref:carbohydrate deacetylase n=1 Tax=Sharpea porci TaxID=2652286 RepID=UPI002A91F451|nr:carbohydrate deacetylase [Sharpea porci]MDY5279037.1 carbohydrate deacetylase [Sharpea porci]